MLNPIEHARTKEDALKYKSEPYVIVADIYSHPHLIGRGGWSWYTGSASWYFVAGVKYILGLNKISNYLIIEPKIPKSWGNCYIKYKIENTEYKINIIRDTGKEDSTNGEMLIYLDNEVVEAKKIKIVDDGKTHVIDIFLEK